MPSGPGGVLPKRTGSTEGFYRSVYSTKESSGSNASTEAANNATSRAQAAMAQEVVNALDLGTSTPTKEPKIEKAGIKTPPRSAGAPPAVRNAGSLAATPAELGIRVSPRPSAARDKLASAGRMRSMRAIKSAMSPAAAAAAAASVSSLSDRSDEPSKHRSMVCALAYRGMEVVFATVCSVDGWSVVGVCSRTRVAFQTLDLPKGKESTTIVSLTADPTTGMVAVAMSNGLIQTYTPVEASPGSTTSPHAVVAAFGRFRWLSGRVIHCGDVFYSGNGDSGNLLHNMRSGRITGQSVHVSSSVNHKVLVAHRDQLAVFDATPLSDIVPVLSVGASEYDVEISSETPPATLLWTTKVHANIVTSKLSGDGDAIVVVLEGEGVGVPDPFGARTFVRDKEDGSTLLVNGPDRPHAVTDQSRQSSSNGAVGILYKPGPFLVHSTNVTRLSFRGLGHVTSNVHSEEDEGNDLLLTYCAEDCSARIFSQNSWKQLMHWTTPPNSRADWVRGISAFTLGDLESGKKKKQSGSRTVSRRPSFGSGAGDESSGGSGAINRSLIGARPFSSVASHSAAPSSAAGAWIAELTFRNAFPALRLSRLSYMKRGNDDAQPAHFESVAAILPAGSLVAGSVLEMEEMGLSVQGIWPAWNPWSAGPAGAETNGTLSGSAMALLGFPSSSAPSGAAFGGSNFGGTHSPPSELRLVASHPVTGNIILMEFPLWGDQDFGAMELGSPLRYVLALSEDIRISSATGHCKTGEATQASVCMDHEASRLCARIEPGAKSIALTWRKQGTPFILPALNRSNNIVMSTGTTIASTLSADSNASYHTFDSQDSCSKGPEPYMDISVVPLPLTLPKLRLPRSGSISVDEIIIALMWWPDDNFGGPPQLLAVTSNGTLILYEMPPPWSAIEPVMPSYDPFDGSAASSLAGDGGLTLSDSRDSGDEHSDDSYEQKEYETMIAPHPDFGIGLRLESQADGMLAIAGSYKKHPLTGGRLPAERTGMIFLGDELLAVNDVPLEGLSFDDIIGTVRKVGADATSGSPLCMRFRPNLPNRRRLGSGGTFRGSVSRRNSERRTIEQMLGVTPKQKKKTTAGDDSDDSHVSMLGAESEMQQEFCRIVAIMRHGLKSDEATAAASDAQSLIMLLPWHMGVGAPDPEKWRGAALLVFALKDTLHAKRLEVSADGDPENARSFDLGSLQLQSVTSRIRSLCLVKAGTDNWSLAVEENDGVVSLVFIGIEADEVARAEPEKETEGTDKPPSSSLRAVFRHHRVFQCSTSSKLLIRAASVELMATMPRGEKSQGISVWSSCPVPVDMDENTAHSCGYVESRLAISNDDRTNNGILDFQFVASGRLDVFPWLVVFTQNSATLFRRSGSKHCWEGIVELTYSGLGCSNDLFGSGLSPFEKLNHVIPFADDLSSPADACPHLIPALRSIVSSCDETKFLRSDWHPESILAYTCTDDEGAKAAFRRSIRGIFEWLSKWMSQNEESRPSLNTQFPLGITPLGAMKRDQGLDNDEEFDNTETVQIAANLMAALSMAPSTKVEKPLSEEDKLLRELQKVLRSSHSPSENHRKHASNATGGRSKEFLLALGGLSDSDAPHGEAKKIEIPPPLNSLSRDEIRLLWAIGEMVAESPKFGSLDVPGQLTKFCVSLFRHLSTAGNDEEKNDTSETSSNTGRFSRKVYGNGQVSREFGGSKWTPSMASAGCMSALVSNHQGSLLEACRIPNEKMNWSTARQLRLPFWIRSDSELRRIAEEIGQRTFKDTRDVMECALFFVAGRNKRTLRNLAATDQNNSGRTFLKFLTNHDFSSQRGRKAAEKNAYSLLRKRRYAVAASFFLLAEPPMLKTALEVIVTQMEDLDLAFMVARLNEAAMSPSSGFNTGGMNLGSMGGGGGFAMGGGINPSQQSEEEKFLEWKPELGLGAKNLINERGLSLADSDNILRAVQLMWLGQRTKASWCLSGLSTDVDVRFDNSPRDAAVPQVFDRPERVANFPATLKLCGASANARVIAKANSVIDFTACPLLLKAMHANTRERWASALNVSSALSRRGIEIPSSRVLLQYTDPKDLEKKREEDNIVTNETLSGNAQSPSSGAASSIFDSFDAPRPQTKASQNVKTGSETTSNMVSSIFDDYNGPPPQKTKSSVSNSTGASSSIFDSFDYPPPKKKQAPQASTLQDTMSSSIFDAFAAPPPKPKSQAVPATPSNEGTASSSVFDSFDVPPKTPAQPESKGNGPSPVQGAPDKSIRAATASDVDDSGIQPDPIASMPTPPVWQEWRDHLIVVSVARRFVRELARIISRFHGDAIDAPMRLFRRHIHPLVPHCAAEILRNHCDGEALLSAVRRSLDELCELSKLEKAAVLDESLVLLACESQPKRIIFAVLLYTVMDRVDLAEDVIRDASHILMLMCEACAFSNDDLVYNRKTYCHISSQYTRRKAVRLSWQLELCLWLNRGGTFPLSIATVKETMVAVRVGLFVASWGRNHECLEKMIRCEPDCLMDYDAGRQLWSSMKLISSAEEKTAAKTGEATSGGWEFLVDCSRDEATDMLRSKPPGSFIIRPHSEDHGVFTLSFKTNLTPTLDGDEDVPRSKSEDPRPQSGEDGSGRPPKPNPRPVKKDEVVQHAIIRLSDSGFRCGSFGPFSSLIKLLEAVSASLPFPLLFNEPPTERIIQDQGTQPSPNSLLFRKLALTSHSETLRWNKATRQSVAVDKMPTNAANPADASNDDKRDGDDKSDFFRTKRFGMFSLLLTISEIRRSLSAVSATEYEDPSIDEVPSWDSSAHPQVADVPLQSFDDDSFGSVSYTTDALGVEELFADSARIMRPFLCWCRLLEVAIALELAPNIDEVTQTTASKPVALAASDTAIEVAPTDVGSCIDGGDAVIRQLIQPDSGVEFRTLRVGEGGESAMLVLFSKNEAIDWFVSTETEKSENDAIARLEMMEKRRVIEEVDLDELATEHEIRYRFVDPWEVEALGSKEGETMAASLGREEYYEFSVGRVARACEFTQRSLGGLHLMGLWSVAKGGICLTKALASVHPPWERDAGGDLQMIGGVSSEPSAFSNSIRQHLYRNAVFRRLKLPQRFLALVQVELLDLKNLTSPGGASALSVYALLRLKRTGSGAPLSLKARTLDSACTLPTKIGKSSGPNAPASWGSLVRFRFPLPEDVNCDGISYDGDREALFKGPPCALQVSVYEKKFMKDILLGGADVKLDALPGGGQLEEWVPLRSGKDGISWFARIRLTLRFELMCLESGEESVEDRPPSVGLRKIQELSRLGGAHEDNGVTKSMSTPDLLSYFESMVY